MFHAFFVSATETFYKPASSLGVEDATKTFFLKMKKFFSLFIAMIAMTTCTSYAQDIASQLSACKERAAKLQTLVNDAPSCGNQNIDAFGESVKGAAIFAIANTAKLDSLYKRQIGETVDGVTDVSVKKPDLQEWISLGSTIAGEGGMIASATNSAQAATEESKKLSEDASKEKNPMKAAKAAKTAKAAASVVTFGNSALAILGEESAAQVKAVQQIIETLKSGKNL